MLKFLRRSFRSRQRRAIPWRQPSNWDISLEESLIADINRLDLTENHNLLILGPKDADNSSFINSILSISKGRKVSTAGTGLIGNATLTRELINYSQSGLLNELYLHACIGIEMDGEMWMHDRDAKLLLEGCIKKGHKFKKEKAITETSMYFRRKPTVYDQMHCVIFVMSAQDIHDDMPQQYVQNITRLQNITFRKHIPMVLILTKVEYLCKKVERDITHMFRSEKIYEAVKRASEVFSMDPAYIHPVVENYEEEDYNVEPIKNIPLLLALKNIIYNATDRIDNVLRDAGDDDGENHNEDN